MNLALLASFLLTPCIFAAALKPRSASPIIPRQNAAGNAAGMNIQKVESSCDVDGKIVPKVFIISMVCNFLLAGVITNSLQFKPEGQVWYTNAFETGSIGNLLARNISLPGSSLVYPGAHCLESCAVCQLTTGESEINAASSITSLMLSPKFDFRKTYFLIAGIAGISPRAGTIADVAFAKYATQVALQYEFDAREIPSNFSTGYVPQGAQHPDQYPQSIYGTEVFELNESLRDIAVGFATSAQLVDTDISKEYRLRYKAPTPHIYEAATRAPKVIKGDIATSDVYFSGTLLGETFERTTKLLTNGSSTYCMTAQEDNATLEAFIRFAHIKMMDFSRIIIMRSAADFDRPYPGLSVIENLFYTHQGSFISSISNLYLAGTPVVKGILKEWTTRFEAGIPAKNYVGDILGSLGGRPDFGPGQSFVQQNPVSAYEALEGDLGVGKRDGKQLSRRDAYKRHAMKGFEGAEMARRALGVA